MFVRVLTCDALPIEARGAHDPPSSSFSSSSPHTPVAHATPNGIAQNKAGKFATSTKEGTVGKIVFWALVTISHNMLHALARLIANKEGRCLIRVLLGIEGPFALKDHEDFNVKAEEETMQCFIDITQMRWFQALKVTNTVLSQRHVLQHVGLTLHVAWIPASQLHSSFDQLQH